MNKQLILGLIITILLHLAFPICSLICDILQKYEKQSLTVRRTPALNRSCKSCSYIFFNIPEENFYGYILDCLSKTSSYVNKYFHEFDKKKFEDNCQFVFKNDEVFCQDLLKRNKNYNETSKICCCNDSYCTRKFFNLN